MLSLCHDTAMGFGSMLLRSYVKQFKPSPKRYYGEVRDAQGQIIWRCDCNHRSQTAAVRCGRREAEWLRRHPGDLANLRPIPWWKR